MSHDDVAKVIRDGCVAPPKKEKKEEEKQERSSSQTSDESVKVVSGARQFILPARVGKGKNQDYLSDFIVNPLRDNVTHMLHNC